MNFRRMAGYIGICGFTFAAALLSLTHATRVQSAQNPIQIENAKTGTTAWQIDNSADSNEIEGYASANSINRGESISFLVNTQASTPDPTYTWQVFRMGWYNGTGGRAITQPATLTLHKQSVPSPDPVTGMVECNWSFPFTVTTSNADPSQWVSGFYLVKLTTSSGKQRYIPFVVRDDSRVSDLLWHVSMNTYEAYNAWGGKGLYTFNSSPSIPQAQVGGAGLNSAVKVSFNRPFDDGWGSGQFLSYDFDMIGFLESEGYDVAYEADLDTHLNSGTLLQHKAVLSVGHDEYWTLQMRQNVTATRDAGVSLGFFGANTIYWQVRYEPSQISGVANRTIVGYKEDADNDPDAQNSSTYPLITTRFRDPHGSLPGQPEDALVGVMYDYQPVDSDIIVVNASHWVFANTGLTNGSHISGLLGYEVDREFGHQPSNTILLAHSPYVNTGSGNTQFADMTIYQAASGAWVFGVGSIQWDWGLSNVSPWGPSSSRVNAAAQQVTRNLLNQFIAQGGPSPTPTATATRTATRTATPTTTASSTAIGGTPTPTATASPTPSATPSPGAPPTFRSAVWTGPPVGTTCPANTPSGVQQGDVEIAMISTLNYGAGTDVTVSPPAGWTKIVGASCADSGKDQQQALFYHIAGASEPASYTWPITGNPFSNACNAIIADYGNVRTANPVDASGCQYGATGTTVTAPSITTLTANDRLLWIGTGFTDGFDASTWTTPIGFTQRTVGESGGNLGSNFADRIFASPGATGPASGTISPGDPHIGGFVALAPAAASQTVTPTATATPTATPTITRTATRTPTATATSTTTVTPTATTTTTVTPTNTATATTSTTATATGTATPTRSATATATPTGTVTATATATSTSTPTATASATQTPTQTSTPTVTSTSTPTATASATQTQTQTSTLTPTPTVTTTSTPTATASATQTPTPAVSLAPTSLQFGNQTVGTTSAARVVTLTNPGSAALLISGIATSGDFAQTNTCSSSIAAGAGCTISVTFTPTRKGSRSGTLMVSDNASGSPQTVQLNGKGR